MSTTHYLVKKQQFYPEPLWVGYCEYCDDADGLGPASTHGYTQMEIDQWFYEHVIGVGE